MSQAYRVSKVVPLPECVVEYLTYNEDPENVIARSTDTIAGIFTNTNYAWFANGPRFEVVNSKNGNKIAAWTFGSILKDTSTKVVCVEEIPTSNKDLPLLVIGLECVLTGGTICVFDLISSKVLRAVQIKDKVTSVSVINSGSDIYSILGPLRAFDGVIAVGTAGGDILIIDLCRHSVEDARFASSAHEIKDELDPCQLILLTFKDVGRIEYHKQKAAQYGNHLAIHLNAVLDNTSPHFVLKGPKGEDRVHVNKKEVAVSAVYYSPQLGSLLVGYNFGAFQLWNIINMTLVYTSSIYEENIPVSHFAVQEPTDDPRIFCYIWAVYSNTEPYHSGFPLANLYALNYESKEWHDGYGYLYEDLQNCTLRFQTELSPLQSDTNKAKGGYCLRLSSFSKGHYNRNYMLETHEDTVTVCSVAWNVWCSDRTIHTYLSVFDLNQWYKEQMPSSPLPGGCKRYMSNVCLSNVVSNSENEKLSLLDAHINESTISQFVGVQKPEEHYYPTTLAFECCTCSEDKIVFVHNQGQQRALLTSLDLTGPLALLKPVEIYENSIKLGLAPLFVEVPLASSIQFQREFLLSVLLEHQMVDWLCKCASLWCNGSYTSAGCSLEFFLNWAWHRVIDIKANIDELCIPLFDYSRVKLDSNTQLILNNGAKQLSNLSIVYQYIFKKLEPFLPNEEVVNYQWNSVNMVSVHLEVLQWLLNVKLLPEYHISTYSNSMQLDTNSAPYPVESLLAYYNDRRSHLESLNKGKYASNISLLFIDNLIDFDCGGCQLHSQWENDGGNGLYPPPSIQSLLRTYLIDDIDITYKHCVIIYVFLDLAMALDQNRHNSVITHLIKFPAVFKLSPGIIKLTQGFWQLDHGDFGTAIELLLDPVICSGDLKLWHHRTILNALLVQEQYNFALLYLQVRRPPLTEIDDVYKAISLLIANNLLDEAFYYHRNNTTSRENEICLLKHIFDECNRTNQIRKLITYGLNPSEEEELMKYLLEVDHPKIEEFQVVYYLQKSRYMDIFLLQDRKNTKSGQLGLVGQKNINFREGIVKTLSSFFPKISRNVLNFCRQEKKTNNVWNKTSRPTPMSVFIHNTEEQAKYKSTLIHAGVSKARETWSHTALHDGPSNEETPFLRTPTVTPVISKCRTSIITPRLINADLTDIDDYGPSPSKKIRLSPRESVGSLSEQQHTMNKSNVSCMTHLIKLSTPIIKRKIPRLSESLRTQEKFAVCTPQSILKVRNLMTHGSSTDSGIKTSAPSLKNMEPPASLTPRALKLSPRKSLSRSIVRFEKPNETTSTSNSSLKRVCDISGISSISFSNETGKTSLGTDTSKDSSHSDVFYSPESSLSLSELKNLPDPMESNEFSKVGIENEDIHKENTVSSDSKAHTEGEMTVSIVEDYPKDDDKEKSPGVYKPVGTTEQTVKLSRSRKSYRDSTPDGIQTRLRTRESLQVDTKESPMTEERPPRKTCTPKKEQPLIHAIPTPRQNDTPKKEESLAHTISTPKSESTSPAKQRRFSQINVPSGRVSGRKSLSRKVLENNAFSTMLSTLNTSGSTLIRTDTESTKSETKLIKSTNQVSSEIFIQHSTHSKTELLGSSENSSDVQEVLNTQSKLSSVYKDTSFSDSVLSDLSDFDIPVSRISLDLPKVSLSLLDTTDTSTSEYEIGELKESNAAGDKYDDESIRELSAVTAKEIDQDHTDVVKEDIVVESKCIGDVRKSNDDSEVTEEIHVENATNVYEDISIASYGDHELNIIFADDVMADVSSNRSQSDAVTDSFKDEYTRENSSQPRTLDVGLNQGCVESNKDRNKISDAMDNSALRQSNDESEKTELDEDSNIYGDVSLTYGDHEVNVLMSSGDTNISDNESESESSGRISADNNVHEMNIQFSDDMEFSAKDVNETDQCRKDNRQPDSVEIIEIRDSSDSNRSTAGSSCNAYDSLSTGDEENSKESETSQNIYCYERNDANNVVTVSTSDSNSSGKSVYSLNKNIELEVDEILSNSDSQQTVDLQTYLEERKRRAENIDNRKCENSVTEENKQVDADVAIEEQKEDESVDEEENKQVHVDVAIEEQKEDESVDEEENKQVHVDIAIDEQKEDESIDKEATNINVVTESNKEDKRKVGEEGNMESMHEENNEIIDTIVADEEENKEIVHDVKSVEHENKKMDTNDGMLDNDDKNKKIATNGKNVGPSESITNTLSDRDQFSDKNSNSIVETTSSTNTGKICTDVAPTEVNVPENKQTPESMPLAHSPSHEAEAELKEENVDMNETDILNYTIESDHLEVSKDCLEKTLFYKSMASVGSLNRTDMLEATIGSSHNSEDEHDLSLRLERTQEEGAADKDLQGGTIATALDVELDGKDSATQIAQATQAKTSTSVKRSHSTKSATPLGTMQLRKRRVSCDTPSPVNITPILRRRSASIDKQVMAAQNLFTKKKFSIRDSSTEKSTGNQRASTPYKRPLRGSSVGLEGDAAEKPSTSAGLSPTQKTAKSDSTSTGESTARKTINFNALQRRLLRSRSVDIEDGAEQQKAVASRKSTRQRSASVDQPTESVADTKLGSTDSEAAIPKVVESEKEDSGTPKKRQLRSNSSDHKQVPLAKSTRTRRTKSVSEVDVDGKKDAFEEGQKVLRKRDRRTASASHLSTISEENVKASHPAGTPQKNRQKRLNSLQDQVQSVDSPSKLEEYSTTRRLTRHQKNILEKGIENIEGGVSEKTDVEKLDKLDDVDPISLLDKPTFEGNTDPDEQKTINSSPSSITDSSAGAKTRKRRKSHDSASSVVSTVASMSDVGSPRRKRGRPPKEIASSPSTKGSPARRKRNTSTEESNASQSVRRTRKNSQTDDVSEKDEDKTGTRRITRQRSKTPEVPDTESISTQKKARRLSVSSRTELSKIPEESSEEGVEGKEEPVVKKGRKKKNAS